MKKTKIVCGLILILIIVVRGRSLNFKENNSNNEIEYENISNEIIENQVQEIKEDSIQEEISNVEDNLIIETINESSNTDTISKTNNNEKVVENKKTEYKQQVIETVQEVSIPIAENANKETTKIESQTNQETQEPVSKSNNISIQVPQNQEVNTEEYKFNNEMTQRIINIINSNPSQFMLQDGYSVEIDNSIVNLTNQFTFTEERVVNKILYKAGTIRVYAQDYYFNGELLFTECYIM